jgi:tetratricopeptide (TPR) repeat protein
MKYIYKSWTLPLLCTLCILIPARPEGADTSPEAESARQEFESRCPRPDWWGRIAVSHVRIDTYDDLLSYWQNKDRTKSEFFKAAYQAILDYPLDADIVATAVKLMNYTGSYRNRMELQEYGVEKFFYYNSLYGQAGDNTAGIVENLAKHYNNSSQYDRTVSLIERLLNERGNEINDHLLELIHLKYAEALHGQNRTDKAISVLQDAINRYDGSWEKQLQSDVSKYERILKNADSVKTTPLVDRPNTFQPWWNNNSQAVYTALIVFILLFVVRNIIKSRTEQKPSRRI